MAQTDNSGGRRWLITGVAGFIGSNLAAFLMEHGESVVGIDNFFSGKQSNVDRLVTQYGGLFSFVEGDILDQQALAQVADGCSKIVHLAAQVSVMRSMDYPEETHDINTTGFMRVLQSAVEVGAQSLVYASSCAVYGDNDSLPLQESEEPRPMSPYAASKLANEAYAAGYRELAPNLVMVGLRFFNIFGAWQDASSGYAAVIPKWIGLLMAGKQPVLFGKGDATRDFCHVENVCLAIWQAANADVTANGRVFNVASGVATPLDKLYATICHALGEVGVTGNLPAPDYQSWRPGEILHSYGNPERASEVLGFQLKVGLEEGIRRLLRDEYGLKAGASI